MGSTPIYSIPFADPTDLVRDWPALSEDVAEAVEAAVAGVPVLAGIGSNVVQAVKTDTFTTSSTSFVPVTGLNVTITPSSVSSKILLIAQVSTGSGADTFQIPAVRISGGNATSYFPSSSGSRTALVNGAYQTQRSSDNDAKAGDLKSSTVVYLDSPESTSPVTYTVEMRTPNSTVAINRTVEDLNDAASVRSVSSITAIEVSA